MGKDLLAGLKSKVHPGSRKVGKLLRKIHRDERAKKSKRESRKIQQQKLDLLFWFKKELDPGLDVPSLVKKYINRNDSEIESLRAKMRPNSVKPTRLLKLETLKKTEEADLANNSFYIPNITIPSGRKKLLSWNGSYSSISEIPLVPFKAS